jgi:hypothetical protein
LDKKDDLSGSSVRDIYLYDNYEDEYDDTFDDADAQIVDPSLSADEAMSNQGGGVGVAVVGADSEGEEGVYEQKVLEILAKTRAKEPGLFEKKNAIRRSLAREELRKATNLTDEQIEGWFIMVIRDVILFFFPLSFLFLFIFLLFLFILFFHFSFSFFIFFFIFYFLFFIFFLNLAKAIHAKESKWRSS